MKTDEGWIRMSSVQSTENEVYLCLKPTEKHSSPHHHLCKGMLPGKLQQSWGGTVKSTGQQSHSRIQQCQFYGMNKQNLSPVDALATFVKHSIQQCMVGHRRAFEEGLGARLSLRVYPGVQKGVSVCLCAPARIREVVGVVWFCETLFCIVTSLLWRSIKERKE